MDTYLHERSEFAMEAVVLFAIVLLWVCFGHQKRNLICAREFLDRDEAIKKINS